MNEVLAPLLWLADNAPSTADLSATQSLMGKFQAKASMCGRDR